MARQKGAQDGGIRQRLPTFQEVLNRKSKPPVDLFCLYIFLQRESAEDALDFWLDVQQHENLCKAYFKDVRRSGRSIAEEWPQYYEQALAHGTAYSDVAGLSDLSSSFKDRRSVASQHDTEKKSLAATSTGGMGKEPLILPRPMSTEPPKESTAADVEAGSRHPASNRRSSTPNVPAGTLLNVSDVREKRWTKRASQRAPTIISRNAAITRGDLLLSAERIYARYLLPGAEKEIYLPQHLRIAEFPLPSQLSAPASQSLQHDSTSLAQVPDMFFSQKEWVYKQMEMDSFPRFLRAKAFCNLTPATSFIRMLAGLFFLWAGLWVAFCLIFLNVTPRRMRLTLLVPFYISTHLLISSQYALDPIMVLLFNTSETTPFHHLPITEPYVKKLLRGRSLWVGFLILLITLCEIMLFYWVPGHRL